MRSAAHAAPTGIGGNSAAARALAFSERVGKPMRHADLVEKLRLWIPVGKHDGSQG